MQPALDKNWLATIEADELPTWVSTLPAINAVLNGLAACLLVGGYVAIRRGHRVAHKRAMLSTFAVSVLFLTCYLIYHAAMKHYTGSGSKSFDGTGLVRTVYLSILVTHSVLAALVPFLALVTIRRGLREDWVAHRRIARVTFPIWVYVSVTGVIIYAMLYHF